MIIGSPQAKTISGVQPNIETVHSRQKVGRMNVCSLDSTPVNEELQEHCTSVQLPTASISPLNKESMNQCQMPSTNTTLQCNTEELSGNPIFSVDTRTLVDVPLPSVSQGNTMRVSMPTTVQSSLPQNLDSSSSAVISSPYIQNALPKFAYSATSIPVNQCQSFGSQQTLYDNNSVCLTSPVVVSQLNPVQHSVGASITSNGTHILVVNPTISVSQSNSPYLQGSSLPTNSASIPPSHVQLSPHVWLPANRESQSLTLCQSPQATEPILNKSSVYSNQVSLVYQNSGWTPVVAVTQLQSPMVRESTQVIECNQPVMIVGSPQAQNITAVQPNIMTAQYNQKVAGVNASNLNSTPVNEELQQYFTPVQLPTASMPSRNPTVKCNTAELIEKPIFSVDSRTLVDVSPSSVSQGRISVPTTFQSNLPPNLNSSNSAVISSPYIQNALPKFAYSATSIPVNQCQSFGSQQTLYDNNSVCLTSPVVVSQLNPVQHSVGAPVTSNATHILVVNPTISVSQSNSPYLQGSSLPTNSVSILPSHVQLSPHVRLPANRESQSLTLCQSPQATESILNKSSVYSNQGSFVYQNSERNPVVTVTQVQNPMECKSIVTKSVLSSVKTVSGKTLSTGPKIPKKSKPPIALVNPVVNTNQETSSNVSVVKESNVNLFKKSVSDPTIWAIDSNVVLLQPSPESSSLVELEKCNNTLYRKMEKASEHEVPVVSVDFSLNKQSSQPINVAIQIKSSQPKLRTYDSLTQESTQFSKNSLSNDLNTDQASRNDSQKTEVNYKCVPVIISPSNSSLQEKNKCQLTSEKEGKMFSKCQSLLSSSLEESCPPLIDLTKSEQTVEEHNESLKSGKQNLPVLIDLTESFSKGHDAYQPVKISETITSSLKSNSAKKQIQISVVNNSSPNTPSFVAPSVVTPTVVKQAIIESHTYDVTQLSQQLQLITPAVVPEPTLPPEVQQESPFLNKEEETKLIIEATAIAWRYNGLSAQELYSVVEDFCHFAGKELHTNNNPSSGDGKSKTKDPIAQYVSKLLQVSPRLASAVRQHERKEQFKSTCTISRLFTTTQNRIDEYIKRGKFPSHRVFSVDAEALSGVSASQPEKTAEVNHKAVDVVSMLVAISASGVTVSPVLIFPKVAGVEVVDIAGALKSQGGVTVMYGRSVDGRVSRILFLAWLKYFCFTTKCSPKDPVLLLMIEHPICKNLAVMRMCYKHGIIPLGVPREAAVYSPLLPSHASQFLMVLKSVFNSFFYSFGSRGNIVAPQFPVAISPAHLAKIFSQTFRHSLQISRFVEWKNRSRQNSPPVQSPLAYSALSKVCLHVIFKEPTVECGTNQQIQQVRPKEQHQVKMQVQGLIVPAQKSSEHTVQQHINMGYAMEAVQQGQQQQGLIQEKGPGMHREEREQHEVWGKVLRQGQERVRCVQGQGQMQGVGAEGQRQIRGVQSSQHSQSQGQILCVQSQQQIQPVQSQIQYSHGLEELQHLQHHSRIQPVHLQQDPKKVQCVKRPRKTQHICREEPLQEKQMLAVQQQMPKQQVQHKHHKEVQQAQHKNREVTTLQQSNLQQEHFASTVSELHPTVEGRLRQLLNEQNVKMSGLPKHRQEEQLHLDNAFSQMNTKNESNRIVFPQASSSQEIPYQGQELTEVVGHSSLKADIAIGRTNQGNYDSEIVPEYIDINQLNYTLQIEKLGPDKFTIIKMLSPKSPAYCEKSYQNPELKKLKTNSCVKISSNTSQLSENTILNQSKTVPSSYSLSENEKLVSQDTGSSDHVVPQNFSQSSTKQSLNNSGKQTKGIYERRKALTNVSECSVGNEHVQDTILPEQTMSLQQSKDHTLPNSYSRNRHLLDSPSQLEFRDNLPIGFDPSQDVSLLNHNHKNNTDPLQQENDSKDSLTALKFSDVHFDAYEMTNSCVTEVIKLEDEPWESLGTSDFQDDKSALKQVLSKGTSENTSSELTTSFLSVFVKEEEIKKEQTCTAESEDSNSSNGVLDNWVCPFQETDCKMEAAIKSPTSPEEDSELCANKTIGINLIGDSEVKQENMNHSDAMAQIPDVNQGAVSLFGTMAKQTTNKEQTTPNLSETTTQQASHTAQAALDSPETIAPQTPDVAQATLDSPETIAPQTPDVAQATLDLDKTRVQQSPDVSPAKLDLSEMQTANEAQLSPNLCETNTPEVPDATSLLRESRNRKNKNPKKRTHNIVTTAFSSNCKSNSGNKIKEKPKTVKNEKSRQLKQKLSGEIKPVVLLHKLPMSVFQVFNPANKDPPKDVVVSIVKDLEKLNAEKISKLKTRRKNIGRVRKRKCDIPESGVVGKKTCLSETGAGERTQDELCKSTDCKSNEETGPTSASTTPNNESSLDSFNQGKCIVVQDPPLCIYCGDFGPGGEIWVKCTKCLGWAHADCSGATTKFVCDYCLLWKR